MSILATIELLQEELDAHPDAHDTRLILADALEEAGEEWAVMGPGYRALGMMRRHPRFVELVQGKSWWWHGVDDRDCEAARDDLPLDWFIAMKGTPKPRRSRRFSWRFFPGKLKRNTRRQMEDAAAIAFAKLPEARQAELLKPQKVSRA